MEEALVKLIKTTIVVTHAYTMQGLDSDKMVDTILEGASLKLHDETIQQLKDFAKQL